jgi:hypothetical protein
MTANQLLARVKKLHPDSKLSFDGTNYCVTFGDQNLWLGDHRSFGDMDWLDDTDTFAAITEAFHSYLVEHYEQSALEMVQA